MCDKCRKLCRAQKKSKSYSRQYQVVIQLVKLYSYLGVQLLNVFLIYVVYFKLLCCSSSQYKYILLLHLLLL